MTREAHPTLTPETAERLMAADVFTVVGTRPQFVKASEVSRRLAEAGLTEFMLHTGQHYDHAMSEAFFETLDLRRPDLNLDIGSGTHGRQTALMLTGIEALLMKTSPHRPPRVLVYGDCNSTLAGALAAAKLGLPLDHVEAGLRSFRRHMPEEINRVLTDRLSDLLFCPTRLALDNLAAEGLTEGVHMVGDVMCDALERQLAQALLHSPTGRHLSGQKTDNDALRAELGLDGDTPLPLPGAYRVATIHRASNTDDPDTLQRLLDCIADPDAPTFLPLHPRTRARIDASSLRLPTAGLVVLPPTGYRATLSLVRFARQLLTDSGGLQKEALMLGTPCITLREETEWVETLESGWNTLTGSDTALIEAAMQAPRPEGSPPRLYGGGSAAVDIANTIKNALGDRA